MYIESPCLPLLPNYLLFGGGMFIRGTVGMCHAGIGATHVNNFLVTLNIPTASEKCLRNHERMIGPVVESVAVSSCVQFTMEVKVLSPAAGITMSYDIGWQKRGRAMNSLSGM